jgi:hypothetical protein
MVFHANSIFCPTDVSEIVLPCLDTQWGFSDTTPVEADVEFAYAGIPIEELYMSQSWYLKHSCGASIQTPDTIQLHHCLQLHCCEHNTCLKSL